MLSVLLLTQHCLNKTISKIRAFVVLLSGYVFTFDSNTVQLLEWLCQSLRPFAWSGSCDGVFIAVVIVVILAVVVTVVVITVVVVVIVAVVVAVVIVVVVISYVVELCGLFCFSYSYPGVKRGSAHCQACYDVPPRPLGSGFILLAMNENHFLKNSKSKRFDRFLSNL